MSVQNQSAFPVQYPFYSEGMSLRDWFAGQALAGICADPELSLSKHQTMEVLCYQIADRMMEARKKFGEVPEVTS